ncbi:MAG: hypothetical protein ACLFSB_11280 [Chitinispirillaceae bacterium]
MEFYYLISIATLVGMFILFLVVSKTLNNIINQLSKMEYLVRTEHDYRKELQEIKEMLALEEKENEQRRREREE